MITLATPLFIAAILASFGIGILVGFKAPSEIHKVEVLSLEDKVRLQDEIVAQYNGDKAKCSGLLTELDNYAKGVVAKGEELSPEFSVILDKLKL